MPYFQNPFDIEWSGTWILADHRYMPQFKIGPNKNTADVMRAWVTEPYDLSANSTLTINYAFDLDLKNYASLAINVQGATPASTTAIEVCNKLNGDATFAELWLAQPVAISGKGVLNLTAQQPQGVNNVNSPNPGEALDYPGYGAAGPYVVSIRSKKRPKQSMRVYISNTSAELALGFNRKAPVAQLPTYFSRHTIANRWTFTDCTANLIELNVGNASDQQVITNAGQDYNVVKDDWEFLDGKSEAFKVIKTAFNGSNQITSTIEYNVGAKVGDLAIKTEYTYTNNNLTGQVSYPYTLQSGDIITPA